MESSPLLGGCRKASSFSADLTCLICSVRAMLSHHALQGQNLTAQLHLGLGDFIRDNYVEVVLGKGLIPGVQQDGQPRAQRKPLLLMVGREVRKLTGEAPQPSHAQWLYLTAPHAPLMHSPWATQEERDLTSSPFRNIAGTAIASWSMAGWPRSQHPPH